MYEIVETVTPLYESLRLFTTFGLDVWDWMTDRRYAPVLEWVWPFGMRVVWRPRKWLRRQ